MQTSLSYFSWLKYCKTNVCKITDDGLPVLDDYLCKNKTSFNHNIEQTLTISVLFFKMRPQRRWTIMVDIVDSSVFIRYHCDNKNLAFGPWATITNDPRKNDNDCRSRLILMPHNVNELRERRHREIISSYVDEPRCPLATRPCNRKKSICNLLVSPQF